MDEAAVAQALQILIAYVEAALGAFAADEVAQAVLGIAVDGAKAPGGGDEGEKPALPAQFVVCRAFQQLPVKDPRKGCGGLSPP